MMVENPVCCEELSRLDGWPRVDGGCWTLELADAAATGAPDDRYAFYTMVGGRRIDLVVEQRPDGEPYLRPAADAEVPLPRLSTPGYARSVSPR